MKHTVIIAAAVLLLAAAYYYADDAPALQPAPAIAAAYTPMNDREAWAVDLAARVGNTTPSGDIVAFIVAWQQAEGTTAQFNPLATSQDMPGATVFNSHGVKNYASRDDGLDATARTLAYAYDGYGDILGGIQTNDAERALRGLYASPWGTNAANVEAIYRSARVRPQEARSAAIASTPLSLSGVCGWNVTVALNANNGALQVVTLKPGDTFSFNATMGNPNGLDYAPCAGVPGGGWCDLAARYAQVARERGLPVQFQHHGLQLAGVEWQDSVAIWNVDGTPGFNAGAQDLLITNTTPAVVTFRVVQQGDNVVVTVE